MGWLAICLALLAFALLFTLSPWNFRNLLPEDGWVESLTAVAAFLAGGLLFAAAWMEKRRFPRIALLVGGLAMVFLSGEEISWGQRIFGFATPDFLSSNNLGESNFHNMPGAILIFKNFFRKLMLLLCYVTFAVYFSGKDSLFRIPLPSLPLALGLLVIFLFAIGPPRPHMESASIGRWLAVFARNEVAVLIIAFSYALSARRPKLALGAFATLALCVACTYVMMHSWNTGTRFRTEEQMEFLLSLFFLCYAAELLLAQWTTAGRARQFAKLNHGWLWPASCALVLSCSAGLMVFERFDFQRDRATMEDLRRLALSSQPAARSRFDVHVIGKHLVYVKTPCDRAELKGVDFFMHLYPKDEADLPRHRKKHGFDNMHVRFNYKGALFQQGCLAAIRLPSYPIVRIRTGQSRWLHRQDHLNLWVVEFHIRDDGSAIGGGNAHGRRRHP